MKGLTTALFCLGVALSLPVMADDHRDRKPDGKRVSKMIKQLDSNDDGMISRDEFTMPERRGSPDMRMDLNGDGEVSRDEVSRVVSDRAEEALSRFDKEDTDGNGVLTAEERRMSAFNRIDADGDGQLTKREFKGSRDDAGRRMKRGRDQRRAKESNSERRGPSDAS